MADDIKLYSAQGEGIIDSGYSPTASELIQVVSGSVAVTVADCPDQYCVQRGYVSGGTPIVCLPHRLVIEFLGVQEIDGILG